jgi:hypothetical protein
MHVTRSVVTQGGMQLTAVHVCSCASKQLVFEDTVPECSISSNSSSSSTKQLDIALACITG